MTDKNADSTLIELHRSSYEIVEGEPDIRGWKVRNAEGRTLGIVDELLFDPYANKVRYIVLDMEGKRLNLVSREILIPIGVAELNELDKEVLLPTITIQHLATLPEYKKGSLTMETERKIRDVLFGDQSVDAESENYQKDEQFYQQTQFDDSRFYKKGIRKAEDVNAKKDSQGTKEVIDIPGEKKTDVENDNLKNEPVQNTFAPFQEGTIEITEKSEVPVVTKEARVVEEISLNKEVTEHEEKVKDTVRKTEVDIEKINDPETGA